jgi:D-alanyl-D-alanine carboxypeptidase (penicillin-binding protein 5/6)
LALAGATGKGVHALTRRPNLVVPVLALWLSMILALSAGFGVPALAETAAATPGAYDDKNPQNLSADDIEGTAAIVIDEKSGRVLFEKNADQKLYPASTTKIMTCLLALEYGHLNDTFTIPKEISKVPADSSLVPLVAGEKMTFIDLLYGMMMHSGNDAAVAVAVIVAGSVDNFVYMMNQKARELGCENTHFANPHGYMDETHYTTARDLATIAREAMKNQTFREIVSARSYTMAPTDKSEKRKMATSNSMFVKTSPFYYQYEVGVKTGYHSKAGQCFVGAAVKNGIPLISVTLKSSKDGKWVDTKRLMEYGYSQYKTFAFNEIYKANPLFATIKNADSEDAGNGLVQLTIVPGGSIANYSVTCLPDDLDATSKELMSRVSVQYSNSLMAPIRQGDILGSISLTGDDGATLTGTVIAGRDVNEIKPASTLGKIVPWVDTMDLSLLWILLGLFGVMTLLIVILRIQHAVRRRRRYQELRRRQQQAYTRYRGYR